MEKKIIKLWNELKRRYNGIYLDLEVVSELNKKGVKVIA